MQIIIVRDGEYQWGADRAALEVAMEAQGWQRIGQRWVEPDTDDDDADNAYARLCRAVPLLEGYGPEDYIAADEDAENVWDPLPYLEVRADLGHGVWLVTESMD